MRARIDCAAGTAEPEGACWHRRRGAGGRRGGGSGDLDGSCAPPRGRLGAAKAPWAQRG